MFPVAYPKTAMRGALYSIFYFINRETATATFLLIE